MKVKQLTDNGINKQKIVAKGNLTSSTAKIFCCDKGSIPVTLTLEIRHIPLRYGILEGRIVNIVHIYRNEYFMIVVMTNYSAIKYI